MKKYSCTIESVTDLNGTTYQLLLNLPDSESIHFKAGQYLDIVLDSERRCSFSIASAPSREKQIELHIRPTSGSEDSQQIETLVKLRKPLVIEAPKGDCFIDSAAPNPLILIAASTGISQMKCILAHLLEKPLTQPVHLYWGVLQDSDLYLDEWFRNCAESEPLFFYTPVVSEPETCPHWEGRCGLVPNVVLEDFPVFSNESIYISGGPGMVYACLDLFVDRGADKSQVFSDMFTVAPRENQTQ